MANFRGSEINKPNIKELMVLKRGRMQEEKRILDEVVGNNIRRERSVRKITREEFADLIELTVSHLGLIERGARGATPVVLMKLSEVLGLTVDYFLTDHDKGKPAQESGNVGIKGKVEVLTSRLNDAELEVLASSIKGIIKLRGDATDCTEVSISE